MPYTATGDFITEKNAQQTKPIYLYTVHEYNGVDNLNFAQWSADVTFDGVTYSKFPITFDVVGENSQGEIEAIKVRLANVSRLIQLYVESYDWHGKKVTITIVFANKLTTPTCKLQFVGFIDSYTADENVVEVTLLPKLDVIRALLPARNYTRNNCTWRRFKGTECAYAGGETACVRTKARCKELLNWTRYGAFPSVPVRRIYV